MRLSAWDKVRYAMGGTTSSLTPLIPAIGDALAIAATKVRGPFGKGASRLHPVGMALGAVQIGYLGYTEVTGKTTYASDASSWLQRAQRESADSIDIGGRWKERHTYGYFVPKSNRVIYNNSMRPTVPWTSGGVVYLP